MKFRKKPIVIDAMKFHGVPEMYSIDFRDECNRMKFLTDWLMEKGSPIFHFRGNSMIIETLEGDMKASPGDWIIRGVSGEFYPCKPDIFALTYEPVE